MKIKRDRILVVTLILLWAYFSFQSWIGSSEYWPVTLSGYWKDWDRAPSLIYKPVFHLVLTPLYFFNLDSVTHLQWAKGLFTFIGGTSLFLLYRILRHHLELLISLLIWGLVLFSQLGFSQLGKIRSDLLSFFFFLFGYLLLVIHEKKKLISTLILLVFFEMLMILTTPKAFLFPLALATICLSINRVNFRHWFWTHVGLFALAIITLLLVTIVRGDFYFYDALQTLFIVSRDSVSTQTSAIDGRFLRLSENAPLVLTVLSLIFFQLEKN